MDDNFDIELLEDEDDGYVNDGTADIEDDQSPLTDLEFLRGRVARLTELRAARDQTKIAADKAKKEFEEFQALFFDEYEKSPLKGSIKVDLGGDIGTVQIVPRRTQFGRILDRDLAEKYFAERAKTSEYMKQDFRMGRLHELVREHLEQKKPLPEGIDFYSKEYFTITFKD